MKKIFYIIAVLFIGLPSFAQDLNISGTVKDDQGQLLTGATIHWKNTTIGTISMDGSFELSTSDVSDTLVVSFVGFTSFEDKVSPGAVLDITLEASLALDEVIVKDRRGSNYISTLSTSNIEYIDDSELRKAACCSLAESFETNGTVDISYTDALTGAKDVKMLGLKGSYTQLLAEKRPLAKGLGSSHLFDYYPGTWIKGIQISKGIATVENGFDNIAGQINFELAKPWEDDKIFLNTFINSFGRVEQNIHLNYPITDKWSMGLLLHASGNRNNVDNNDDLFLDTPQKTSLNGLYRVFYRGKYLFSQLNLQYINNTVTAGQVNTELDNPYIVDLEGERFDVFGKLGYVGFEDPNKSIGFIYNLTRHNADEAYGPYRSRTGQQNYAYTNFMFASKPGENSKITTGFSTMYSDLQSNFAAVDYNILEKQAGIFIDFNTDFVSRSEEENTENKSSCSEETKKDACCSEETKKDACCSDEAKKDACCSDKTKASNRFLQNLGLISGLRVDQHNLYGLLVSPRLSLKYNFNDKTIVRLNAGKGYKTPYILSENIGMLVNNANIIIEENLNVESAWNLGINFTKEMSLGGRNFVVNADLYHTNFDNKIIMDLNQNYDIVYFYNQRGRTNSTYFLVMANLEINKHLRFKGAYKYNHMESGFLGGLKTPPLFAKNRGLITLEYATDQDIWMFNLSTQFVGSQVFPNHRGLNPGVDLTDHVGVAPAYQLFNVHISKKITDKFEMYVGGENLGNFVQKNPIIDYENPFSSSFNASHVYAPTLGIRGYMGIRWTIK